jgi:hypothetical protein
MASAVAASNLFGMKTKEQAIALMLVAQSEGLHPARAAMEYHVIQGRPALKADAMLARFQAAGGKVDWKEYTDDKVSGVFSHLSGGSVTVDWTIERAKQAGVYGKNPTWKTYPRAMLRARCISEGIRTVYPGVSVGIYTPEEVQDFAEKDITPTQAKPSKMPESVKEQAANMKSKVAVKNFIDGEATTISGDPMEGDLSGIGGDMPMTDSVKGKILEGFAAIGFDQTSLEVEYGKPMSEWMESDIPEMREVLKAKKIEQAQQAQEAQQNSQQAEL